MAAIFICSDGKRFLTQFSLQKLFIKVYFKWKRITSIVKGIRFFIFAYGKQAN